MELKKAYQKELLLVYLFAVAVFSGFFVKNKLLHGLKLRKHDLLMPTGKSAAVAK